MAGSSAAARAAPPSVTLGAPPMHGPTFPLQLMTSLSAGRCCRLMDLPPPIYCTEVLDSPACLPACLPEVQLPAAWTRSAVAVFNFELRLSKPHGPKLSLPLPLTTSFYHIHHVRRHPYPSLSSAVPTLFPGVGALLPTASHRLSSQFWPRSRKGG